MNCNLLDMSRVCHKRLSIKTSSKKFFLLLPFSAFRGEADKAEALFVFNTWKNNSEMERGKKAGPPQLTVIPLFG